MPTDGRSPDLPGWETLREGGSSSSVEDNVGELGTMKAPKPVAGPSKRRLSSHTLSLNEARRILSQSGAKAVAGPSRFAQNDPERPLKRQKTGNEGPRPPPNARNFAETSAETQCIDIITSEEEADTSPPGRPTTQVARKSTGGRKPRRSTLSSEPSSPASSSSPPPRRLAFARKTTGGKSPRHIQPMVEASSKPSVSTPVPSSSKNMPPSPAHSIIVISSDEDEPPPKPVGPGSSINTYSTIKVSPSTKAQRIAPVTTMSSISASFVVPTLSKGKGKGKANQSGTLWGSLGEGLLDAIGKNESASAGPSTFKKNKLVKEQGRVQSNLDSYMGPPTPTASKATTTATMAELPPLPKKVAPASISAPRPPTAMPPSKSATPSISTSIPTSLRKKVPEPPRQTIHVSGRLVYTPPSDSMDIDQPNPAPSPPDMRHLEKALGLADSITAGTNKERRSTPPVVIVKDQLVSPNLRETTRPPPPPHSASLADVMNGRGKLRISGFGTAESPLELVDSDDEAPAQRPPPPPPPPLPVVRNKKKSQNGPPSNKVPATSSSTLVGVSVPPVVPAPPIVSVPPVARTIVPDSPTASSRTTKVAPTTANSEPSTVPVLKPTTPPALANVEPASPMAKTKQNPPSASMMSNVLNASKALKQVMQPKKNQATQSKLNVSASETLSPSAPKPGADPVPVLYSLPGSATPAAAPTGLLSASGPTPLTPLPPMVLPDPIKVSVASVPLGRTTSPGNQAPANHFIQARATSALGSRSSSESVDDHPAKSTPGSPKAPSRATSKGQAKPPSLLTSTMLDDHPPPVSGAGPSFGLGALHAGGEAENSEDEAHMELDGGFVSRRSSTELSDLATALGHQEIQSEGTSRRGSSCKMTPESSSAPITPAPEDVATDPEFGFADEDEEARGVMETLDLVLQKVSTAPRKTFGGIPVYTFEDYREEMRNEPFETFYARNLPTGLPDYVNWSEFRALPVPQQRELLKAYMREHTAEDEPDAPLIDIINDIDDEATPPWEFHYSNRMWLSDLVPPPDMKSLEGCDCIGKCNPSSKSSCGCVRRQQEWRQKCGFVNSQFNGFRYDKSGRLKDVEAMHSYPIFECNALCGCDEDCYNRVVQDGRKVAVSIKKTKDKGWGVFAGPKKIPKGSFLGIYSGEVITNEEGEERGFVYNKSGRTYLFDLDFFHLNIEQDDNWENLYTVDAYHAGNFTRFLNHSCDPNVRIHPCYINEGNLDKPLLAMFTDRDVAAYEEICFCYYGNPDEWTDDPEPVEIKKDAVYEKCLCGAAKCRGYMFN